MSVNDTLDEDSYGVSIKVPAKLMEALITKGEKPTVVLTKVIQRMASEMDTEEILHYAKEISELPIRKKEKVISKPVALNRAWDQATFNDYIDKLLKRAERDAFVADLVSMLVAYIDTGPRPTSDELREARGFGPSDKWYEELRISKARLTIAAKHMGLSSFFPRAYGSGMKRRHPMSEEFYQFLRQWYADNKVVADRYRQLASPRAADY